MPQGPAAFGVQTGVKGRGLLIQQLLCTEPVKPQQPVRLIEPMLPQQGRLGLLGGEKGTFHHRHIGGEKYPFQLIPVIKPLRQPQNVEVAVRRGTHDHLGALARRGELGCVAVLDQFFFILNTSDLDLPHRSQYSGLRLFRGQSPQSCL